MADQTQRLDDILSAVKIKEDQDAREKAADRRMEQEARVKADRFDSLYSDKRERVVFPILDGVARKLRDAGQTAGVEDERIGGVQVTTLKFKPKGQGQSQTLTFTCLASKELVSVSDSTLRTTRVGSEATTTYELDQLTAELIQELAVSFVRRIFQG
jgi:hypothetical protein